MEALSFWMNVCSEIILSSELLFLYTPADGLFWRICL